MVQDILVVGARSISRLCQWPKRRLGWISTPSSFPWPRPQAVLMGSRARALYVVVAPQRAEPACPPDGTPVSSRLVAHL